MRSASLPTLEEIDRIVEHPDVAVRNLQITQCYHELSAALREQVGAGANWCSFATWASKQAGQTIRKEDLARLLASALEAAPAGAKALDELVDRAKRSGVACGAAEARAALWHALDPGGIIEHTSRAVAVGNLKVFEEIGREFARFIALLRSSPTSDAIARFCSDLRPGEPPAGQGYLRRAFAHYAEARLERDPRARSELMLLAGLEVGFHEQVRLQPQIAAALDAPFTAPEELARRLRDRILPRTGFTARLRKALDALLGRHHPLDAPARAVCTAAQGEIRHALTEHLMQLWLPPDVRLRLGRDLAAAFPAALQRPRHPDLIALLTRIDPTDNSVRKTGARDWADFPERIHYIADFFRCYLEHGPLFHPPFSAEQVGILKRGELAPGTL